MKFFTDAIKWLNKGDEKSELPTLDAIASLGIYTAYGAMFLGLFLLLSSLKGVKLFDFTKGDNLTYIQIMLSGMLLYLPSASLMSVAQNPKRFFAGRQWRIGVPIVFTFWVFAVFVILPFFKEAVTTSGDRIGKKLPQEVIIRMTEKWTEGEWIIITSILSSILCFAFIFLYWLMLRRNKG